MSRWSRRTEHDKMMISAEQNERHQMQKKNVPTGIDFGMRHVEHAVEVWKEGELPLWCSKCRTYMKAETYKIREENVFTDDRKRMNVIKVVYGSCSECKTEAARLFSAFPENVFWYVFKKLRDAGRAGSTT